MNFAFLETGGSNYLLMGGVLVMLVAMYFLMMRPQKKKEQEAKERRNAIEIGDEVTTIGGIVGRVVSLKEDTFVIETAGERSRLRFKRWAIQDVGKLNLEDGARLEAPPEEKKSFFGSLFGGKKNSEEGSEDTKNAS